MSVGFNPHCKFCTKKYYVGSQDRLLNKQKLYDKQNRDKINTRMKEYIRNRRDSDLDFKLACVRLSKLRMLERQIKLLIY